MINITEVLRSHGCQYETFFLEEQKENWSGNPFLSVFLTQCYLLPHPQAPCSAQWEMVPFCSRPCPLEEIWGRRHLLLWDEWLISFHRMWASDWCHSSPIPRGQYFPDVLRLSCPDTPSNSSKIYILFKGKSYIRPQKSLIKFKEVEISSVISEHKGVNLEISNRRKAGKLKIILKLNNTSE